MTSFGVGMATTISKVATTMTFCTAMMPIQTVTSLAIPISMTVMT